MKKIILPLLFFIFFAGNSYAQNVGIGTTTPGTKFTVFNNSYGIEHTNGTASIKTYISGTLAQIGTFSNHPFQLMAGNGTNQFVLLPTGEVGINTTTPGTRLTVVTVGSNYGIEHTNGTVSIKTFMSGTLAQIGTYSNHPFQLMAFNGTNQFVLMPSGVVGIGNGNPSLAGLVVDTKVGAANAIFGSNTTGVEIESSFPGIGFNSYYNSGRKFIAAGFAGYMGLNPTNGNFVISNTAASGAANASATVNDAITITPAGNVGIGTSVPAGTLDIDGTTKTKGLTSTTLGGLYAITGNSVSGTAIFGVASGTGRGGEFSSASGPALITDLGNVGIGTSTPNSALQVNGALSLPIKTITSDYTVNNSDYTIYIPNTGGDFTLSIPAASSAYTGRIYKIISDPEVPAWTHSVVIGGVYTDVFYATSYGGIPYVSYGATFQCTGTKWVMIEHNEYYHY